MKIAVLSDIHGNLPALVAVAADVAAWQPDLTVVNGDVVNRGPSSLACWNFIQSQRWHILAGNHEAYVLSWREADNPFLEEGMPELYAPSAWSYRQLGAEVEQLARLPETVSLAGPGGGEVRVTHGSMRGNRDGIYPEAPATEIAAQIAPAPAVFCTAHTHRPFVQTLNGTLLVNSGAAGWTFDRDPRASYARLVWQRGRWQAEIVRLSYDRQQAERDYVTSGYYEAGGALAHLMYVEWYCAIPLFHLWVPDYEPGVLAGEWSIAEAVAALLAAQGLDGVRPSS